MPYLPHRSRSLQSRRGARLHKAPERRHVRPSQRRPRQEDRLRPLLHQAGDLGQWARALVRAIAEDDRLARRLAGGRRLQQPQVPVDVPVERAAEASRLGCPHDYRRAHGGEVGRRRAGGEAGGEALVHAKRRGMPRALWFWNQTVTRPRIFFGVSRFFRWARPPRRPQTAARRSQTAGRRPQTAVRPTLPRRRPPPARPSVTARAPFRRHTLRAYGSTDYSV